MSLDTILDEEAPKTPFGQTEEEAIASLMVDHPEFFANIIPHISSALFARLEVKYVIENVLNYYQEYQAFPTRGILRDRITRQLTVNHSSVDDILAIVDRESNPREIPGIRARIGEWVKHKAFDQLFSNETIAKFHAGDYAYIEDVFEKARRVQEVGGTSLWFFNELEKLFEDNESERFTTGNSAIDHELNDGGPTRKEMLVWMAPTGVGKCHTLDTKIIEERLSAIFILELANGQTVKAAGFREVQTTRGTVKICDLAETDDIIEISSFNDSGDIQLPVV